MISLGPVNDIEKVKSCFLENGLEYNENSKCVAAICGDEMLGFCLFDMDNKSITVRFLKPEEDLSLADGILRSTLHVAAERSVMDARYAESVSEDMLNKIGFIKDKSEKKLDIDKLFKSCCSCN